MAVKVELNHNLRFHSILKFVCISISVTLLVQVQIASTKGTDTGAPLRISDVDTSGRLVKKCSSKPIIEIVTPKYELDTAGVIYNKSGGEIFVPGKILLSLECLSSRPIDFDFEGYLANKLHSVETARIVEDGFGDCYSIVVRFVTDREATGKYVCWNIHEERRTAVPALYVFANGGSPPYLLYGDTGKSVIESSASPSGEFAVIPCAATNPNVPVALYKVERESFKLLTLGGNHISYEPKIGFKLSLRKFPDEPFGKYKCIAQNSTHFDVIVNLSQQIENVNSVKSPESQVQISTNHFPENQSSFICSGLGSVSLHSSVNCKSFLECRLAQRCLKGDTICSQSSSKCSLRGDPCSKSLKSKYYESSLKLGDGCGTILKNTNGGVVQCNSKNVEGNDTWVMYFIGLTGKIVQNWKAAPTAEILAISPVQEGSGNIFYVGEEIGFSCNASRFVFSKGMEWNFKLLNGNVIPANTSGLQRTLTDSFINEEVKIKISDPQIHSVLCSAPVWNETTWIQSSLILRVRDTVAPVFFDPSNVTISFYPNDKNKSIVCEATAYPQPDIMWLRNGEEFLTNFRFDISVDNVTKAELTFKEIAELDDGFVYTCNASNPRGMAFKTFLIEVKAHPSTLIFSVAGVGLFICFGIVIFISFILLRRMQKKKAGYVFYFTNSDMDEFTNGNPEAVKKCSYVCQKAVYLPYDAKTYEIEEDDLSVDYDNILGQGEFGVVLKGKLTRNSITIPVAVKTLKGSDMNHLKSILSELKIMIYIGYHKNIVTLLGAVTRNLIEKRVSVVVEYCALGNLELYLRQHRATFLDEFGSAGSIICANAAPYVRIEYLVKTSDLIRWAYEIATGMAYLAKMKVIHGDLALRNVLLGQNLEIKITDFGLSKQLYKCTSNYVTKRKEVPLPWRWLAIETLQDHNFSTQSDVWSYGIILWELFSLAEIPYAGVTFSIEFLRLLGNGYRLDRPRYCNPEIYSIMRECWRREASQRPSFKTLRQDIALMLPTGTIESDSELEIQSQNDTNHLKEDLLLPNRIGDHIHEIRV